MAQINNDYKKEWKKVETADKKGLTKDATVKITDVSGSLIYQTKALGGQAIWDGKNLQGERAASGVYLVFSSNADGSESCTTKIMLVN